MSRCALIESLEVRTCLSVSFLPAVQTPIGNTALVALGDFDGDGKADLLAKSPDGPVRLFKGTGDGHFAATTTSQLPAVQNVNGIAVGDFNHDMKLDVAFSRAGSTTNDGGGVVVLLGHGDGTFAAPLNLYGGGIPRGLAVADLNHDGKLDIVVADAAPWSPPGTALPARFAGALLLGNGDGTFQPARQVLVDGPQSMVAVRREPPAISTDAAGFVAFGGTIRPSATTEPAAAIFTALIGADGTSHSRTLRPFVEGQLRGVDVANLNADGLPDLVALQVYAGDGGVNAAGTNTRVHTYLGSSDGSFTPRANVPAGVLNGAGVIAADFDHDGKVDVAVAGRDPRPTDNPVLGGVVSVLPGNGEGGFTEPQRFRVSTPAFTFAVGDLNNDHRPDVVTGGAGGVNALVNNSQSTTISDSTDDSVSGSVDQVVDSAT